MPKTTEGHPGTPTERNAFPVGKSIFAGVITLIVVRYIFGLIPLYYPIAGDRGEFYYKGQVLSISPPAGYCYTKQKDLLENLFQVTDSLLRYDEAAAFVTFKTFLPCDEVYTNSPITHGYQKFLTRAHYAKDEQPTIQEIGFVGVGNQLLPTSPDAVNLWLNSNWKQDFTAATILPPRLAPYFEEFFDYRTALAAREIATLAWSNDDREERGMGYCSTALGYLLELDEDLASSPLDRWKAARENFATAIRSGRAERRAAIKLSLYVTSMFGRAIYYGMAERVNEGENLSVAQAIAFEWSDRRCKEAAVSAQPQGELDLEFADLNNKGVRSRSAERGVVGIDKN